MAKRLTDTNKWRKAWIQELEPEYKLLWLYICDECDHAGIWDVELRVAEARLGVKLDKTKALQALGERIQELQEGDKWFIRGFIDFQYQGAKGSMSKCIVSARKRLESLGLSWEQVTLSEPLAKGCQTLKVKVKVKVKDKVSIIDGGEVEECYQAYPPKREDDNKSSTAKSPSLKPKMQKILDSGYPLLKAIKFHKATAHRGYFKNLSTFLNNLPDENEVNAWGEKKPDEQPTHKCMDDAGEWVEAADHPSGLGGYPKRRCRVCGKEWLDLNDKLWLASRSS